MTPDRRSILFSLSTLPFAGKAIADAAAPVSVAPFKIDSYMCLGVVIKGELVEAIFDTGASNCLIDEGLAQKLNIKRATSTQAQFVYEKGALDVSEPVEISLGGASLKLPMLVGKLVNMRHDMLLGLDAASQVIMATDPAKRTALIMPRGRRRLPPARKIAFRQEGRYLLFDLTLEGRTVEARIDTGDPVALTVHSDWAKQTGFLNGKRVSQWIGGDLSGAHPVMRTSAEHLQLGGFDFHNVPVHIEEDQLKYPVTIGAPAFMRLFAIWDLGALTLWLPERQSGLDAPFTRDRSGLAYMPDGDAVKVIFIAPDSPAAKAGWKIGDRIAKIDGVPYKTLSDDLAWKEDPTRKTANLTLDTGEVRVLTLSDYY